MRDPYKIETRSILKAAEKLTKKYICRPVRSNKSYIRDPILQTHLSYGILEILSGDKTFEVNL